MTWPCGAGPATPRSRRRPVDVRMSRRNVGRGQWRGHLAASSRCIRHNGSERGAGEHAGLPTRQGLEVLVVRGLAGPLLRLAGYLFGLVLQLVVEPHGCLLETGLVRRTYFRSPVSACAHPRCPWKVLCSASPDAESYPPMSL